MEHKAQVAVIGAGHAGVEAAYAAARAGADVVLFTMSLDAIANMPCNPSIGGTAKGHLVYEIDAMDGLMPIAADRVTLQSRTLNTGKGAAVRSKRIQADRTAYRVFVKNFIEKVPNIRLVQAEITDIATVPDSEYGKKIKSITTGAGDEWSVDAAVICCGTYPGGLIHIGDYRMESGPDGQLPSRGLSEALAREGIAMRRFKTGTPQRINKRSVDLSALEIQPGEPDPLPFSSYTPENAFEGFEGVPCYIVYTNENTHRIIRENLNRSAMYSGQIHGTGPRYCPSIEDKIVRFADKERHQLFLEPTGADSSETYLQGFSTSMPTEIQDLMVHSLKGFENAEIMRYAYAIEYDCTDPLQLFPTLEFKQISGLYGAGQFNGTSGYEEAAAQGVVAGANAALKLFGKKPFILSRLSSYTGTLIDDLVTKGTNEPYRMMTSRSEFRLLLRQDNADLRLTEQARSAGIVSDERYGIFKEKAARIQECTEKLRKSNLSPTEANKVLEAKGSDPVSTGIKEADLLRRPEISLCDLFPIDPSLPSLPRRVASCAETEIKYEGYIKRETLEAEKQKKLEDMPLPVDIDYRSVAGLRIEAAEKLNKIKPINIGRASEISGVNPADITVLIIRFRRKI